MTRVLGTLLLLCLVAGCTSDQESRRKAPNAAPSEASYSRTQGLEPTWQKRLRVLGQPLVLDDVAVVLARKGAGLQMVAVDVVDGRTLWRKDYSSADFVPGVALEPQVTKNARGEDLVLVRAPDSDKIPGYYYSPLQIVVPRTGKVLGERGGQQAFGACDDGHDVCFDGEYYLSGVPADLGDFAPIAGGSPPTRWDVDHPRREPMERGGVAAAFSIGPGDLYASRIGEQRMMRLGEDGVAWSRLMPTLFGPRATTDRGWSFDHFAEADVYAGAVGRDFPKRLRGLFDRGRPVSYDYDEYKQMVGIDGGTGERLWRIPGADPWCDLAEAPASSAVTCVLTGSVTEQQDRDTRREGIGVELRGFEPLSGETTWSIQLDQESATKSYLDGRKALAPAGVVVGTADGRVSVDLARGTSSTVADDVVTFCSDGVSQLKDLERSGGTLYSRCTADGSPTTAAVSEWGVSAIPGSGEWRLVSVKRMLEGYRLAVDG